MTRSRISWGARERWRPDHTVESFAYDDLYRLVAAHRRAPNDVTKEWEYQYDRIGDLVAATVDGTIVSTDLERDDSGRVVRTEDLAIRWDAQGRVASVRGSGMRVSNLYDYEGRRVVRSLVRFADSQSDERVLSLFRDYEHHGDRVVKFVELFGGLVVTAETSLLVDPASTDVYFHHTDHLGTSILRFDGMGTRVGKSVLAPYGAFEVTQGVEPSGRGFTGAPQDGSLGLTAFEARYLHEATGRFLSPDPELLHVSEPPAFPQALNVYAYSLNRPYTFIDWDGRFPLPVIASAAPLLWQHRGDIWDSAKSGYDASTRAAESFATASADRLMSAGGKPQDDPLAAAGLFVASLWTRETAPRTAATVSYAFSGPVLLKNSYQWIRIGSSFMRSAGPTGLSIKWGAGKATFWQRGQRVTKDFADDIPELTRGLNKWLRNRQLPGTSHEGHLHIIKNPVFSSDAVRKGVNKVLEGIQRLTPSGAMSWYFWRRGTASPTKNRSSE